MKHGFVKVAAATPKVVVADAAYNADVICDSIAEASAAGAKVIVLPELCITGYTCGDLFLQEKFHNLQKSRRNNMLRLQNQYSRTTALTNPTSSASLPSMGS